METNIGTLRLAVAGNVTVYFKVLWDGQKNIAAVIMDSPEGVQKVFT